ncbi:MAG: pitrilysin family protein [Anaerolineales bacterium]|jgi:zinc protease
MTPPRTQSTQYRQSSLPGPDDVKREQLPNGITVLARANFNSPSVVISGYLNAGSLFDSDEKLGLAQFTAAALMRGTEQRSFQEIYEAVESVGAGLNVRGGTHTTGFSGKALTEDLDMLLDLLAEVLRYPIFPAKQIARLRAQLLTGLAIRAQNTSDMASLTFDEIVYKSHPYSRPDDGYPETIQAISPDDLTEFHRQHFGPQGLVIAVVGALEPEGAVKRVGQALGDWSNPSQPEPPQLPPLPSLKSTIREKSMIAGKSQADLVMGAAGPMRRSPDFLAAALGNNILGQFGMMGRIGEAVREKAGLAYYAYSSLSGGMGPGPWAVSAGVDPQNVDQVVELARNEIARIVGEPVSTDELNDSKTNFIGRLPLALESNAGVAGALLNLERYDLGLDYYQRYAELINAVTPVEVMRVAQRYLHPDRLGIAVAGP